MFQDRLGQILEINDSVVFMRYSKLMVGHINSFLSDSEIVIVFSWSEDEKRYTTHTLDSDSIVKIDEIKKNCPELFI